MDYHYQLIVAGKNIVLNAQGFLEDIEIAVAPPAQALPLEKGLAHIAGDAANQWVAATVHNGQPLLIRRATDLPDLKMDKAIQAFTQSSGTDVMCLLMDEQLNFSDYVYYRDGKLLKTTLEEGGVPVKLPYEKLGTAPELVLTAFCDSWLALKQLSWHLFKKQPALEQAK